MTSDTLTIDEMANALYQAVDAKRNANFSFDDFHVAGGGMVLVARPAFANQLREAIRRDVGEPAEVLGKAIH